MGCQCVTVSVFLFMQEAEVIIVVTVYSTTSTKDMEDPCRKLLLIKGIDGRDIRIGWKDLAMVKQ